MFAPTHDGLVVDRVILRPANADAEQDLRRFLQRFRDPDVEIEAKIAGEGKIAPKERH